MILRKLGPIMIALVCVSTIASYTYILHITIYAENFLKNTNFFVYTLFAARIKHEIRINNIMANLMNAQSNNEYAAVETLLRLNARGNYFFRYVHCTLHVHAK